MNVSTESVWELPGVTRPRKVDYQEINLLGKLGKPVYNL